MRFETSAIVTLAALASASNIETRDGTPKESNIHHPLLQSDDDNHSNHLYYLFSNEQHSVDLFSNEQHSVDLFSKEQHSVDLTKSALRSSKLIPKSVPFTKPIDLDLGILTSVPIDEDDDLEAMSTGLAEGAEMFGRNLEGTAGYPESFHSNCETYCAEFTRPVIEASGWAFAALLYDCMFYQMSCPYYNVPVSCWNTSKVTDMRNAVYYDNYWLSFDERLDCWDVSKVTSMDSMFYESRFFNQPLNEWDVSRVTDMNTMFMYAKNFNQPLNEWNVSQVTNMNTMFTDAMKFNQPLDKWNVSRVKSMNFMFAYARSFNQPLDKWDVSQVEMMTGMFFNAYSFSQCLPSWGEKTSPHWFGYLFENSGCESWSTSNGVWCNRCACIDDAFFYFNGNKNRDCNWIGKKPLKRCRKRDMKTGRQVSEACPMTCDLRCKCKDRRKKFESKGEKLKCKKVDPETQCNQRVTCKKYWCPIIADICPKTCGDCLLKGENQ